jgi:hypothetical protein
MVSRYVSNALVYLGASEEREPGGLVGEQAVLNAVHGLENRGHTIVVDNFFTSIPLAMSLLARGFWCTGTVKNSSRGFPSSLVGLKSNSRVNMPPRGHLNVRMHRSREVAAVCWVDNKPVWLLSTATEPVDSTARAPRWLRGHYTERHEFPTSPILLEYQRNMRGIDVLDQQRVEYTVQLQSHKWWHRLLLFVLDTSCQNAYVLYKEDAEQVGLPVTSRLLWHYTLGMRLVQPWLAAGALRGPHRQLTPPGFHRIEGHPTSRRGCVVCSKRTRCYYRGCAGAFMCKDSCYITVHTQPGHAVNFRL